MQILLFNSQMIFFLVLFGLTSSRNSIDLGLTSSRNSIDRHEGRKYIDRHEALSILNQLVPGMNAFSDYILDHSAIDNKDKKLVKDYMMESLSNPTISTFYDTLVHTIDNKMGSFYSSNSYKDESQFAQDLSKDLYSKYILHLKESVKNWINSHGNGLRKRQAEFSQQPMRKYKNPWGLLKYNAKSRYISNIVQQLLMVPLWFGLVSGGGGALGSYAALLLFQTIFLNTVWQRVVFGKWS